MDDTNTTQSNIEKAESVANIVQAVVNKVAEKYGGNIALAFSNVLTGNGAVVTSLGDLIDKFNDGTATSKDIGDVLQDLASIVAGIGFVAGKANPWVFGVLSIVGAIKGINDYIDANPNLKKEIFEIFDNPSVDNFIDIWDFFDKKFDITDTLRSIWEDFDGGEDFDTYIAHNGDFISDDDGLGEVLLGNEHLDGGEKKTIKHIEVTTTNFTKTYIYCECKTVTKWSEVKTTELPNTGDDYYIDKATGTKYILNGSSLQVISSTGTITINDFSDGDLGIHLTSTEKIDKKEISKEVFLEEDFCSPLVLDLNGNGKSSTRLNESSVYFDMDGDGFKERTAWVESGDGLLVLDKNSNGTIDNGTELFGNFTQLGDGSYDFAINSRNFKRYKEVA